jgi:Na+/H+ antiporter NhaD/arsenite permease-like protein
MNLILIVLAFTVGYVVIVFEEKLQFNKTSAALLTGVFCWTIYALTTTNDVSLQLGQHLISIAEILFFLLGAMTIVELVDAHNGFDLITEKITTRNPRKLLWVVALLAFFLSAVLDNLTTAIVMVSLLRKLVPTSELRLLMAGMVVIAANAGGAWSPIGDVTTTMLWIGGQITATAIITKLFIPSAISLLVPLCFLGFDKAFKTDIPTLTSSKSESSLQNRIEQRIMLGVGLGGFLFVPIFKTITHLPPYMGILLVLGIIWATSEFLHKDKDEAEREPLTAAFALSRIDTPSVLFFLGILLAVGCLEATQVLHGLANWLNNTVGNLNVIVVLIGIASSVIDNVPLVAATMGMYDLATYPADSSLWEFLAYCAGTGGSILIIGSAAGVAVMGMERIDFGWYLRKISWLAMLGYLAGAAVYLLF